MWWPFFLQGIAEHHKPTPSSLPLVTLLTVVFSPLSFNYAYVWLIYPTTLALYLVSVRPSSTRWHRLKITWIASVILIPALAIPMPLLAQAYGNLIVPALLLVFGLGTMLYAAGHPGTESARIISANSPLREGHAVSTASTVVRHS